MSTATAALPAWSAFAKREAINPWIIAVTVTLATFMELLDTAIANVSLPHIAGGLAVSYDESTWVLTSYLVSNAIVLPLSAWLSRVFGRKRYYMLCVVLHKHTNWDHLSDFDEEGRLRSAGIHSGGRSCAQGR